MRNLPARTVPIFLAFILVVCAGTVAAEEGTIGLVKDNSLYEDQEGDVSNGSGAHLFVGRTNNGALRRALLAFDIAGNIPTGSVVEAVTLTLNLSKTRTGTERLVEVHRVLADWGEGASDAAAQEGGGTSAAEGDATWLHGSFEGAPWATAGGDFAASPSASADVGSNGSYTWNSTSQLVADVQAWYDDPTSNFGWILLGAEGEMARPSVSTVGRIRTKR